jgi:hypothetical protein
MKFTKVVINGKEYYEKVEDKCDRFTDKNDFEPEIIDVEIEDTKENSDSAKYKKQRDEFFDKVSSGAKDFGEKFVAGAKGLGEKISVGAKDLGNKIKSGTERLFNKDKTTDPESTEAKLLKLLPYMSKKEAHKVAEMLLTNDEMLRTINISAVMPFLSADDCDAIFTRCIELGNTEYDLATAIPYVRSSCLSDIVDDYIDGKYPDLVIDDLYPFLSDSDIKHLFYHIIETDKKKKNGE